MAVHLILIQCTKPSYKDKACSIKSSLKIKNDALDDFLLQIGLLIFAKTVRLHGGRITRNSFEVTPC